jgi:phage gpG-like protein
MPPPKKINITKLLRQLDQFGDEGARLAVAITNSTAEKITNSARLRSPVDLGQLRQSIGNTEATVKQNTSFVFANAPYAAFQNFGTGGLIDIPKGFEELALQFKGKGIRQINIPATGFLTTPYIYEAAEYPKRLNSGIDKLTKQYNNKK